MNLNHEIKNRRRLGKEIREALKAVSPVTIDVLHECIKPTISKKNLRQALGILRRKGEVDMMIGGHNLFYYQLSQALPVREKLAQKLKCDAGELIEPLLRRQDWFHNQWSRLWEKVIQTRFPSAVIVREYVVGSNHLAQEVLLIEKEDIDCRPEFLVFFPKTKTTRSVSIAFEIERTRKSERRLKKKFDKYMNATRLDGVIYICDSGRLSETLRMIYQKSLIEKAFRIGHYGKHFFLFSDCLSAGPGAFERLFIAEGTRVSLAPWIDILRIKSTLRTLERALRTLMTALLINAASHTSEVRT
ncbi:MAG: hypothetical protein EOP06_01450 [Proteobacteria bacterium]|nr:MAG: hypothetical protein EOP06_01450 [Pseudomonadota bacterium]